MMKKLLLSVALLLPLYSFSEHCWMVSSCVGKVGYLVVAESHYKYVDGETGVLDGKPYAVDAQSKIFKENGHPVVDGHYTLNGNYYELFNISKNNNDMVAVAKWFKKNNDYLLRWNKDNTEAKLRVMITQFGIGNQLQGGTVVKIKSIRLLKEEITSITKEHLLIMVEVISEPDI